MAQKRYTESQRDELLARVRAGEAIKHVARDLEVSVSVATRWCREAGVKSMVKGHLTEGARRWANPIQVHSGWGER